MSSLEINYQIDDLNESSSSIFKKLVQKYNEQEQNEEMEVEQLMQKNEVNYAIDTSQENVFQSKLSSPSNESIQLTLQNQQSTKKVARKRSNKLKQVEYKLIPINEKNIYRDISMIQKCYMLSGGIVVELQQINENADECIVGSLKSIQHVQKHNQGAISINFEYIIHLLERSQDQDHYQISTMLRQYSTPIQNLTLSIQQVIKSFDQNQLLSVIQERQQYMEQIIKQNMNQYLRDEEFTQMITFQINWALKSINLSSFYMSKAIIALLGTVNEDYIQYIMRNGLFQMFNQYSRRRILDIAIKYYLKKAELTHYDEIPDFELLTLDNILIKCCCQMHTIRIQYPEHLQFFDQNQSNINNVESISIMQFVITQQHLESIINLREQIIHQNNNYCHNQNESDEQESNYIAQNFEYYMQSELFLQNFYQEKYHNLLSQKNQLKQPQQICSFKFIKQ